MLCAARPDLRLRGRLSARAEAGDLVEKLGRKERGNHIRKECDRRAPCTSYSFLPEKNMLYFFYSLLPLVSSLMLH